MKEIFKTVVEPLISLPKCYFWIQTILICVYHINFKEDAEKVLKSPSYYPLAATKKLLSMGETPDTGRGYGNHGG